MLVAIARKNGFTAYIGSGDNAWNAVHTLDAARPYRLVLEGACAGTRWHAAAEEELPFRSIAEAIGTKLGVPTRSPSSEEAPGYFGGFLNFGGCIARRQAPTPGPPWAGRRRTTLSWKIWLCRTTFREGRRGIPDFRATLAWSWLAPCAGSWRRRLTVGILREVEARMQLDPDTRRAIEKTRTVVRASEAGLRALCFPSQLLRERHQERGGDPLRDAGNPGT